MKHQSLLRHPAAPLLVIALVAGTPVLLAAGLPAVSRMTDTCLHLLRFCFAALVEIDPVLHGLPLLVLAAGVMRAAIHRTGAVRRGGRILGRLPSRTPFAGETIHRIASKVGALQETRIMLGPVPNPAFTGGMLWPRIYVAESLLAALDERELEAVLLHELHHCRRRDPMRSTAAAALADVFFWIPLVRDAMAAAQARIEFAADDAARHLGDLVLAAAILKVAEVSRATVSASSAFVSQHLLERRVERLLGTHAAEREPWPARRAIVLSVAAIVLIWGLGVASSAAHAAHLPQSGEHCPHHHDLGVLHASASVNGP